MTAAISFDGHTLETDRPIGIDVATREFIRAHFRFSQQNRYYCVCPSQDAYNLFLEYALDENISKNECYSINQNNALGLEEANCLMRYDPGIIKNAWLRRYQTQTLYSLCGVVHASASEQIMELIGSYSLAPLQPWDALICPSKSIQSAIRSLLDQWNEYLKEKFSTNSDCPIMLPIIPMGVDGYKHNKLVSPDKRQIQREQLDLLEDEIAILYVGRLNYISKANPLPLLIAAEEAAKLISYPIRILFYGYFNDNFNKNAFHSAIQSICKKVKVSFVTHGNKDFPDGIWAAADIFCSMSDSIQESFGLTPIEAMACGLPLIVSDWNGYKDTVTNGVEGFKIPTYMPNFGVGNTIAYKYFSNQFSYGDYLAATSQSTAIDIRKLTQAIKDLANNAQKRNQMGNAGIQKIAKEYDWKKIIPLYNELWKELKSYRIGDLEIAPKSEGASFHPSHPDPFLMFKEFPTETLSIYGRLSLAIKNWEIAHDRIKLDVGLIIPETLMPLEELPNLISLLENDSSPSIEEISQTLSDIDHSELLMTIVWLIKLGICDYSPPG